MFSRPATKTTGLYAYPHLIHTLHDTMLAMSVSVTVVIVNTDLEALGDFSEINQSAPDLEQCLDWITGLVWQGYTLFSVTVYFDHCNHLSLPPRLFDDQLFSPVISQLAQEWRQILSTH